MWLQASASQYSSVNTNEYSDFSDLEGRDNDDSIDPRVQEELERLNNATDDINKLEVELDDARAAFRQLLSDTTQRINMVAKKIGGSVEKARPYYDARMKAKEAHTETQKAALRFERANSAHAAAKEMVFLAEEGLQKEGRTFDPAWQEMLNHATMRVNEAERERTLSEQEHRKTSTAYNQVDSVVKDYMKELKKHISKSSLSARRNLLQLNDLAHQHQLLLLPYFEMKAEFNKRMEEQKRRVQELEESVLKSKLNYADALHNLEEISDEIHKRRKRREERRALGQRGTGVGAEHPEEPGGGRKHHQHPEEVARPMSRIDDEYMDLPKPARLPKSQSSTALSQSQQQQQQQPAATTPERSVTIRSNGNGHRLKKSKSVADRSEASPLFGRYSISRRNRLQVDHASQTECDLRKVGLDLSGLSLPCPAFPKQNHEINREVHPENRQEDHREISRDVHHNNHEINRDVYQENHHGVHQELNQEDHREINKNVHHKENREVNQDNRNANHEINGSVFQEDHHEGNHHEINDDVHREGNQDNRDGSHLHLDRGDATSQTECDLRKGGLGMPLPKKPASLSPNHEDNYLRPASREASAASSSSVSSVHSSGTTSPVGGSGGGALFGSVTRRGVCLLPNPMMAASLFSDNGDISDTESLASIDVLSDEQIADLMMDQDLEAVAESLRVKMMRNTVLDGEEVTRGRSRTTQTNNVVAVDATAPKSS